MYARRCREGGNGPASAAVVPYGVLLPPVRLSADSKRGLRTRLARLPRSPRLRDSASDSEVLHGLLVRLHPVRIGYMFT